MKTIDSDGHTLRSMYSLMCVEAFACAARSGLAANHVDRWRTGPCSEHTWVVLTTEYFAVLISVRGPTLLEIPHVKNGKQLAVRLPGSYCKINSVLPLLKFTACFCFYKSSRKQSCQTMANANLSVT